MNEDITESGAGGASFTRRRMVATLGATVASFAGCATASDRTRTPFVIEYELAPGASAKSGLQALTDTGAEIFGSAILSERNPGLSAFGGTIRFPRWVQVTWREGVTPGEYWTTGTVVADYRVEVLSRIPEELFEQMRAAPRRVIKLLFRVKDDGVLLAWCIEEHVKNGYLESLHGGDFKKPVMKNGQVIEPGWQK